jgi:hypothetical protein
MVEELEKINIHVFDKENKLILYDCHEYIKLANLNVSNVLSSKIFIEHEDFKTIKRGRYLTKMLTTNGLYKLAFAFRANYPSTERPFKELRSILMNHTTQLGEKIIIKKTGRLQSKYKFSVSENKDCRARYHKKLEQAIVDIYKFETVDELVDIFSEFFKSRSSIVINGESVKKRDILEQVVRKIDNGELMKIFITQVVKEIEQVTKDPLLAAEAHILSNCSKEGHMMRRFVNMTLFNI